MLPALQSRAGPIWTSFPDFALYVGRPLVDWYFVVDSYLPRQVGRLSESQLDASLAQAETIVPAAPDRLVFTSAPQTVTAGSCSGAATVEAHDVHGNPVQIDADENGVADDPAVLDAAWKAGVFHELRTFRQLMPYALASSHSTSIYEPGIAEIFNGIGFGFLTANVLEGEMSFPNVWDRYNAWMTQAKFDNMILDYI